MDVVKEIWLSLVHALKGEYNPTKGDSNAIFRKQEVFKKRCERLNVFFMFNGCICWRCQPPLWYFLPGHEACGHVQVVDKGTEFHEEIIDKGLLQKRGVLYLAMLWEICMQNVVHK